MITFPDKKDICSLSISTIKSIFKSTEADDDIIELLSSDSRAGVRYFAKTLRNRRRREERLCNKQEAMFSIERELIVGGKKLIAGVDEAGRGPACPVVAGAVVLPDDFDPPGLDDSKKLTSKKRVELFEKITANAIAWGIGMVDNEEIDEIGILPSTMKSMFIAVENLKMTPDIVLIDGNQSPHLTCEERLIVNGDEQCRSIAAASIIAKVTRDRIMIEMDTVFREYGFARHKGYGARAHVTAIQRYGPCGIHRFSFKIVPRTAPAGTCSAILKKRLLNAISREEFDRAVSGIARIRHMLHECDIEALREVYKTEKRRFSEIE